MICGLCLNEIDFESKTIKFENKDCHDSCVFELENMIEELIKIHEDTCPTDIYNMNRK